LVSFQPAGRDPRGNATQGGEFLPEGLSRNPGPTLPDAGTGVKVKVAVHDEMLAEALRIESYAAA
jgi:hypothetical protein